MTNSILPFQQDYIQKLNEQTTFYQNCLVNLNNQIQTTFLRQDVLKALPVDSDLYKFYALNYNASPLSDVPLSLSTIHKQGDIGESKIYPNTDLPSLEQILCLNKDLDELFISENESITFDQSFQNSDFESDDSFEIMADENMTLALASPIINTTKLKNSINQTFDSINEDKNDVMDITDVNPDDSIVGNLNKRRKIVKSGDTFKTQNSVTTLNSNKADFDNKVGTLKKQKAFLSSKFKKMKNFITDSFEKDKKSESEIKLMTKSQQLFTESHSKPKSSKLTNRYSFRSMSKKDAYLKRSKQSQMANSFTSPKSCSNFEPNYETLTFNQAIKDKKRKKKHYSERNTAPNTPMTNFEKKPRSKTLDHKRPKKYKSKRKSNVYKSMENFNNDGSFMTQYRDDRSRQFINYSIDNYGSQI